MNDKPEVIAPDLRRTPAEMQAERRWVGWRLEARDGRWTKVPVRIDGRSKQYHRLARTDDPSTWATFEEAQRAVESHALDGVGFVLGDGYCGADLDKCRDVNTGATMPAARQVMAAMPGAWWEVSPSGTGWKCFGRTADPNIRGFEIRYNVEPKAVPFRGARYFAFTGRTANAEAPTTLVNLTRVMEEWARVDPLPDQLSLPIQADRPAWLKEGDVRGTEHLPKPKPLAEFTDDQIIDIARRAPNGAKFAALFDEGTLALHGMDHSRADAALLSILAFWTARDADRMVRLFDRSKLVRPKWHAASYRRATLGKALRACTSVWEPETDPTGKRSTRHLVPEAPVRPEGQVLLNDDDPTPTRQTAAD